MPEVKVLLKHGTAAEVDGYVGVAGEIVIKENAAAMHVMDGVTAGGDNIEGATYTAGTASITTPINNATGVAVSPILQCAAFNGNGTAVASYWEVATDAAFNNIVKSSGRYTSSVSQYTVSGTLEYLTQYYVRVRLESSFGLLTPWSDTVSFTTSIAVIMENGSFANNYGPENQEVFGYSLDTSNTGDVVIVGTPFRDGTTGDDNQGKVEVYDGNSFTRLFLLNGYNITNSYMGYLVRMSGNGNFAMAKATNESTGKGVVSFFDRMFPGSTWGHRVPVAPSDLYPNDNFGANMAISDDGTYAVIRSNNMEDNQGVNNSYGAIYVYKFDGNTWNFIQKIKPPILANSYYASRFLDISNNGKYIVAGRSSGFNTNLYVYKNNGADVYSEVGILPYVGSENNAALKIIGNEADKILLRMQSSFIYFDKTGADTWTINPSTISGISTGGGFGSNSDGTVLMIGTQDATVNGVSSAGKIEQYTMVGQTWVKSAELYLNSPQPADRIGSINSIGYKGGKLFTTAVYRNNSQGRVYRFA